MLLAAPHILLTSVPTNYLGCVVVVGTQQCAQHDVVDYLGAVATDLVSRAALGNDRSLDSQMLEAQIAGQSQTTQKM